MTVKQALEAADALRPNAVSQSVKLKWLCDIESRIYNEIYITHEHDGIDFTDTNKLNLQDNAELFAKRPYDEIYVLYLCAAIDFAHAEHERQSNDLALFKALYSGFSKEWNREHISIKNTPVTG